jgi:hypothetical protein
VFWGFGKDEILLEMKKRERERKVRRVKARKRVGFEHGRGVVVVVAAFWSRNFALCFESGGFCRGGGGGFPDLVKKGRMAIWASNLFFLGG